MSPESDDEKVVPITAAYAHVSGRAECQLCKHQWMCVAPIGTFPLECPACGAFKGLWRDYIDLPTGTYVYACPRCDGIMLSIYVAFPGVATVHCYGCAFESPLDEVAAIVPPIIPR